MTVARPIKEENPRRCQEPSVEIVVLIILSFLPDFSSSAAFFIFTSVDFIYDGITLSYLGYQRMFLISAVVKCSYTHTMF